ncbi:aromatic ring-hydroxylating dioxygenase subunit alpha [Streptomyces sp. NPDC060205]|uniref:aromatic ring-hydroxylating oxygenase subunit alpha n=1 Tax=Streptomyces sp. NPDC060205 TaxID=3347072 RepID=UPI0036634B64
MREETQSQLVGRLLTHIDEATTDVSEHVSLRSSDPYGDEEVYRREVDRIFRREPFIVAHVTQLASPGDYVADDLLGVPFLLVKQSDGEIRGFVDLCRHRGTRLVAPGAGSAVAEGFTCPWHGWRYGLDGGLCGITDRQRGFPGIDMARRGLLSLTTEVRHGFVWATLDADGERGAAELADVADVARQLGSLDAEFTDLGLDTHTVYGHSRRPGRFNWKLGIEAFLETYHFRWLHPAMKKYVFAPDLSLVDGIGRHVRLVAPKKSVLGNRDLRPEDRRIRDHATIAYVLFPSTVLFLEKRHITVMSMRPTAVDACDVRFLHAVREDTLHRRAYYDDNIGKFMDAAAEDFAALELAQDGFGRPGAVRAPGHGSVVFGRNEWGLQLFRANVDAALAEQDPALSEKEDRR